MAATRATIDQRIQPHLTVLVGAQVTAAVDISGRSLPLPVQSLPTANLRDDAPAGATSAAGGGDDGIAAIARPLNRLGEPGDDDATTARQTETAAVVLRQIHDTARTAIGAEPTTATLILPSTWGPRRRDLIRRAAAHAGIARPRLQQLAVAAAQVALAEQSIAADDACVVVIDLRADTEITLLRESDSTWQQLAATTVDGAGTDDLDAAITTHLIAQTGDPMLADRLTTPRTPDDQRDAHTLRADITRAREAVTAGGRTAVVLPDPHPPQLLTSEQIHRFAEPLAHAIARHTAQLLLAADTTTDHIAATILVGDLALARALTPHLPQAPITLAAQQLVTHGHAATHDSEAAPAQLRAATPMPAIADVIGVIAPAFTSGLLLLSILDSSAQLATHGPGGTLDVAYFDALFDNAGFAMTALTAVHAAIAGGRMLASTLLSDHAGGRARQSQATRALLGAAGFGIGLAVLYALLASALLGPDAGRFLPQVIWPGVPAVLVTTLIALAAPHLPAFAGRDWTTYVRFPIVPLLLAALGVALTQAAGWGVDWLPFIPYNLWLSVGGPAGTALLGIAAALTLTRGRWLRLGLGLLLGLGGAIVYSLDNATTMIVGFVVCAALWWMRAAASFAGAAMSLTPGRWAAWLRNIVSSPAVGPGSGASID